MKSLLYAGLIALLASSASARLNVVASSSVGSSAAAAQELTLTNWDLSSTAAPTTLYPVTVPNTVLGALFTSNAPGYDFDPMYGENLEMVDKTKFDVPWVFNTTFDVAANSSAVVLNLNGVIYNATVYVNGVQYVDDELYGGFRRFKLGITDMVSTGVNTLRIEVQKPFEKPKEVRDGTGLSVSFYDWAPHPADLSMGLWRPVSVSVLPPGAPVTLNGLAIKTSVSVSQPVQPLSTVVTLNASVVASNWGVAAVTKNVWLHLAHPSIDGIIKVSKTVTIPATSELRIDFPWTAYPQLVLIEADIDRLLWWPWQMGAQNMAVATAGVTAEQPLLTKKVGFRSMESRLTLGGALQIYVNNIPILIRAGAWCPDLFLRTDTQRLENQFKMVMGMNLNAIRLEGKAEHAKFFEIADEKGLLLLADLGCCEKFPNWSHTDFHVATKAMREQVRKLESHPSVAWILASSDFLGPDYVEKQFYQVYAEEAWPNIVVSSASENYSPLTGTSGVKLTGPYSWVPPNYWLGDSSPKVANHGGAWGFFTEGGPGEAPMTYDSWNKTIPLEHQWSVEGSNSTWWNYHMGNPNGLFKSLDMFFTPPLVARYGASSGAKDYLYRSQAANYESIRSMYEGYTRNKHRNATGVVQWMMNNAWPSNLWHLFDWHLGAGGGFYGAKKACTKGVHVMMSPVDGMVTLINSNFHTIAYPGLPLTITAKIVSLQGTVKWSATTTTTIVPSDASIDLPAIQVPILGGNMFQAHETFLVHLEASVIGPDSTEEVDENWYWQSPTTDVLEFSQSNGYRTPCSQWANFTQLQSLGRAPLGVSANYTGPTSISVTVTNSGSAPSFFTHMRVHNKKTGKDYAPQIWSDNFVTIMPGATKTYTAEVYALLDTSGAEVIVENYNGVVAGN